MSFAAVGIGTGAHNFCIHKSSIQFCWCIYGRRVKWGSLKLAAITIVTGFVCLFICRKVTHRLFCGNGTLYQSCYGNMTHCPDCQHQLRPLPSRSAKQINTALTECLTLFLKWNSHNIFISVTLFRINVSRSSFLYSC